MRPLTFAILTLAALRLALGAAPTPPKEHFGFSIGDDYHLANYTQTEAYFQRLARESDRIRLVDMGRTEEGRTQWMVVISSPANLAKLERFKEISRRLARSEGLSDAEAAALASEGRAVVWIDGGLHASETVGSHQLIETVWQLASAEDPETLRFLNDVIILCAHANPDGQELVANWYMREPVPEKRSISTTPRLYQKYIGHDNNRDFYLSSQRETTNINRQLYLEWFPQVVYNHHQTGPAGTVIFVPPFRDPFNYNYDPLVMVGVQTLGTAIQSRFLAEGKPGATSRSGANYSTWFNGGLRTTSYFHNMIGLLSEIIGSPNPIQIPFIARRQLPHGDLTAPVPPQTWHYRQSIDYSLSANRAVLDYASRQRDTLLLNAYRMGRNSIDRGSRDSWTPRPSRLEEIQRLATKEGSSDGTEENTDPDEPPSPQNQRLSPKHYNLLRQPDWRDPRGFILPADQPDFPTAVHFINALLKNGILVHRATADFTVNGRRYPSGSYVVRCDQAFRPQVLDMFEPQDHPNDLKYPGGPPNKPYDTTGYTLALQMGIRFDRILTAFDGPFARIPYGELQPPPAVPFASHPEATGYLVSHQPNNSAILLNRLLKAGLAPRWLRQPPADLPQLGSGALFVPATPGALPILTAAARDLGLTIHASRLQPSPSDSLLLRPTRIALWDRYGGSMPSGWTRWLLEQFEFPFQVVYSQEIDAGRLREKYDAIIFVRGAIPSPGGRTMMINHPRNLPPEFERWTGRLTTEKSIGPIRDFLEKGGTVVAIGSSTNLAYHLGLPIRNGLAEPGGSGKRARPLSDEKFYIPGSILEARVDPALPLAWGMPDRVDVFFERSPAFVLEPGSAAPAVQRVAWYDSAQPLRSGWGLGQNLLKDRVAIATAQVGSGHLHLMGSEVAFRAQTHGTFKLLFNALHLSTADGNPR